MNPMKVAQNRTARLVREAQRPVYSSVSPTRVPSVKHALAQDNLLSKIESLACGEDFCHICGRCTDHWGEHSDEQLLAWGGEPGIFQSLLKG